MRKIIFFILVLFFVAKGEEKIIRIRELYENFEKYDGKEVIIIGEAIGDIMGRGDEKWINLKDEFEDFCIGVVINKKDVEKIKLLGKYKVRGDLLKIYGIYNVKCEKHVGERDIHALKIEILKSGEVLKEEINIFKIFISFFLLLITVFIMSLSHKKRKT